MKNLDDTYTQKLVRKFTDQAMKTKYLSKKEEYDLLLSFKKKHDTKALSKLIQGW